MALELSELVLSQTEWIEQAASPRRLKFRRDSTGYYEREASPEGRFVQEKFLYRVEGGRLHLKFAHARSWTDTGATVHANDVAADVRVGAKTLTLERDPYAWGIEERPTGALALASDTGAMLPS
jgi:hypothetical protein